MAKYGTPLYGAQTYGVTIATTTLPSPLLIQNLIPQLTSGLYVNAASAAIQMTAGGGGVHIGPVPSVSGDAFEIPIALSTSGSLTVDLATSTWQTGEPQDNVLSVRTIWMQYPPYSTGVLNVTSTETGIGYWIEIYVGSSLERLTLAASGQYVPTPTSGTGGHPQPAAPITVSAPIGYTDSVYVRVSPVAGATQASFNVTYALGALANPLALSLTTSSILRAPAVVRGGVTSAVPNVAVTVDLLAANGVTVIATTTQLADSTGTLSDFALVLPAVDAGTYTARVTQGANSDTETYTVLNNPYASADTTAGNSTPGTGTGGTVVRWLFEDPAPGGLGLWQVPANPDQMSSPWPTRPITTARTVAPRGVAMNWQGTPSGNDWTFSGTVTTQAHMDQLNAYAQLDRRIYVTDHRSRVWIVGIRDIDWTRMPSPNQYAWKYKVDASIFGTLTALPTPPTSDPGSLVTGFDSNAVKMLIPTASLTGSTITASVDVQTSRSVDFTLLQIVATPKVSGTAFSMSANPGTHSGTVTLSGTGEIDAPGTWTVQAAYSIVSSPTDADVIKGPATSVASPVANPTPPGQPAPGPGTPSTSSAALFGVSGDEVASGAYQGWVGASVPAAGSWNDASLDDHINQWSVQSGATWGRWTGILDLAVGGVYLPGGDSWSAAASGSYDARWTTCLTNIRNGWGSRPAGNLFVNPFREFNLSGANPWPVTSGQEANFAAAFRRFYNLKQSIFPGCHLVMTPNDGTSNALGIDWRNCFPGASYVDAMGVDSYNQYPHVNDQSSFNSKINGTDGHGAPLGIEKHRQFAASVGKPLIVCEWANNGDTNAEGGGGESPNYMQYFHDWQVANAGNGSGQVWYSVLFNMWSQFQIWPTTKQPATAAKWKSLTGS